MRAPVLSARPLSTSPGFQELDEGKLWSQQETSGGNESLTDRLSEVEWLSQSQADQAGSQGHLQQALHGED